MKASCLCGAVKFEAPDTVEGLSVCRCTRCRKQSGHLWASARAPKDRIAVGGEVRWFEASPTAKRGFCPICGSFLFWKAHDEDVLSFALGAVDGRTGVRLARHVFTATRGDRYGLAAGLPENP